LCGDSGSNSSGDKTENGKGEIDYWVAKLAPESSSSHQIGTINLTPRVYPNPADVAIYIDLAKIQGTTYSLNLCTVEGTVVYTKASTPIPADKLLSMPILEVPEGLYFLSIITDVGKSEAYKIWVRH
jgi:Secretion system C-terminal sorting domain